ncbi:UDP-N-acetylglucosamine 1-carboxyvinyltransferase [Mobilibacterium timonense]|uniref:UDP-N-acetylglucosamine 1-carboxyvinyltransferase n=1 Tax=Mobilibacterium timonense TaxID=1871012 RepID=UPI002352A5FB|nr:UDP-N-acetylglucosamine 1-carboxyvinyltransferase [Mobilibacterium timonense]MBM6990406.1 UDP-N-acetylglucosamine 1-carboxyvinyltransferase [Mobilibacterium timonense]
MAKLIVENGGPLYGEVQISGAKNAVLPLMAATLLTEEKCVIDGVPDLADVKVMKGMLENFGATVVDDGNGLLEITASQIRTVNGDRKLVTEMRASTVAMGPLLARCGKVVMPLPGGCAIGKRPIDLHLKGFRALGATVIEDDENEQVIVTAGPKGLVGDAIYLDFPSVGATENILMASTMAAGTTIIENAAKEPEIVDLANQLNKMGAKIKGAGTDTIRVTGVERMGGSIHSVIPDRIETGTFMLAAAITRGEILVKNALPGHVRPIIAKLKECGVEVETVDDGIYVNARDKELIATNIKTLPYPGFPTDIQSPFMAFLTTVKGKSEVKETVFENRFMHVNELNRMGADITIENRIAYIPGGKTLHGAKVRATDLRAGAAMVLAGLAAEGKTEVSEIYHIERGYEKFVEKFTGLGALLTRVDED